MGRRPGERDSPAEIWRQAALETRRRRWEDLLAFHLERWQLPTPEREFRFDARRRWRFDFAWPALRLAVEVEGVTWAGGRHQRVRGFEADAEKYNAAEVAGWTVLRFTPRQVKAAYAVREIERALGRLGGGE